MSKRNKIVISLAVTAFLIVSLIVGLVVVFAEENPSVVRNVNAVYRVYNADCSVSVSYTYGNKSLNTYLDERGFTASGLEGGDNVLVFNNAVDAGKQVQIEEKTLKPASDIVLTKENDSVIFEFKFANFGETAFNATMLEKNKDLSNVIVHYSMNGTRWSVNNQPLEVAAKSGEVAGTASYFVRVSLIDAEKEYVLAEDFTWTIINNF